MAFLLCFHSGSLIIKSKILTMKTRFLELASVLILVSFLTVSCYKSKTDYNSPNTAESKVGITSAGYSPASLTILSGSKVTWTNNDNVAHTITTADGGINSGDIAPGSSYSRSFTTTAIFNYYDAHNTSMMGVLVVSAASSGGGY